MFSIGVLFRRYSSILRSKDLTLVHTLSGGLSSQFFSNEEKTGVLVNRKLSSVSDGKSHELGSRSVVCYISIVTFVFWRSARAKICMKNWSTIIKAFAMWALYTDNIMKKKDSCLIPTDIVNFSTVSSITESVSCIKPKFQLWVKNKVKNGHSVQYLIGNRAVIDSVKANSLLSNPSRIECSGRCGKKKVVQVNAFSHLKGMLNTTSFNKYCLRFKLYTVYSKSKVTRNYSTLSKEVKQNQKKYSMLILEKKVFKKQIEVALLAQKFGTTAKEVLNMQVKLVRTYDFRLLAVLTVIQNKRSKTLSIGSTIIQNYEGIEIMVSQLLVFLNRPNEYRVSPVRKCFVPTSLGGKKLLRVLTVQDRCLQNLVTLIVEPVIEPFSDLHSFSFRRNKSAKNALAALKYALRGKSYDKFILDADIKDFFDNISHDWLAKNVPLASIFKDFLVKWLQSRIVFQPIYETSYAGISQGGVVSCVLSNFVLDGLEKRVTKSCDFETKSVSGDMTICYKNAGCETFRKWKLFKLKTIRYADDFTVFGRSRRILEVIKPEVINFLQERGLVLSQEKTRILNFQKEPIHFLGYTFKYRKY
jgi:group II intron reverse transcriptase/maturase